MNKKTNKASEAKVSIESQSTQLSEKASTYHDATGDIFHNIATSTDSTINPNMLNQQTINQLQGTIGNHAVGQLLENQKTTNSIQRQTTSPPPLIYVSIAQIREATQITDINENSFNEAINFSYRTIITAEETTKNLPNGQQLLAELRKHYRDIMSDFMRRAADSLGKGVDELYNENRGRIPMWAWQESHSKKEGTSTPIPDSATTNSTGNPTIQIGNNITVEILPDEINAPIGMHAYTIPRPYITIPAEYKGERITSLGQPSIKITIKTRYRSEVSPSDTSSYGRGTTPEDLAGARVTPESKSLGFHEGSHGFHIIEELKKLQTFPVFEGEKGMRVHEFRAAKSDFAGEWAIKLNRIRRVSAQRTDNVGTPRP